MENKKLGIEDLTKCVMLAVEVGNVADAMGRTKGMAKYGHLMAIMDEMTLMAGVSMANVIAQCKDLDGEERVQLHNAIKLKLDLADEELELVIVEALGLIVDGAALIQRAVRMVKNFKKDA